MTERNDEIFIGRQPILGRNHELFAYELLFRSGRQRNAADIPDDLVEIPVPPKRKPAQRQLKLF